MVFHWEKRETPLNKEPAPGHGKKALSAAECLKLLGKVSSKAQSAMEYLTTYGWSILVIAVVVLALYMTGAFNAGSASLPTECLAQQGFLCATPAMDTTGNLLVTIGQMSGTTYDITGLACVSTDNAPSGSQFIPFYTTVESGLETGIKFQCPLSSNAVGSGFHGTIWIQYNKGSQTGMVSEVATVTATAVTPQNIEPVYPSGVAYDSFSSSSTPNAIAASGNQIYVCAIAASQQINSESWEVATNAPYTSIGTQSGNMCSASLASLGSSSMAVFGVDIPTTTVRSYTQSIASAPWNYYALTYTVTNAINTVVIALVSTGGESSGSIPYGCTEELGEGDVYYAICINQAVGIYTVGTTWTNGDISMAAFVYETPGPAPNPSYNATTSLSLKASVLPGNQIYICTMDINDQQASSISWSQTVNTLRTFVGVQSGSTCSASTQSYVSWYSDAISAYGVNAPTVRVTPYTQAWFSSPWAYHNLAYIVTNSINTVVIALSGSGGAYVPSGCTSELQGQDSAYYAICTNQATGSYIISTWTGGDESAAAFVFENPVLHDVPVTLSNSQSSATPSGFQQMISFNPSTYSAHETANLSNIEFTSGAPIGTPGNVPLYAWIESGASNSASNTVVWVNLGSSTVPAESGSTPGTLTIYMNFVPGTDPVTSGYTGYAPQLWCGSDCEQTSYAQYDNGANVFTNYWNFAGTTLPNGWTSGGAGGTLTVTVNNGITIQMTSTGGTWGFGHVYTTGAYNTQLVEGFLSSFNIGNGNDYARLGLMTSPINIGEEGTNGYDFFLFNAYVTTDQSLEKYVNGGQANLVTGSTTPSSNTVYSLMWPATGQESTLVNYGNLISSADSSITQANSYIDLEQTANGAPDGYTVQWLRTRAYPPSGVMPSVSFGSVT